MSERKAKIDRNHALVVTRQCKALAISRSSAYRAATVVGAEDLDLMRKLDELHLRHPFKGSRRLRDDLWDDYGRQVNRKRVQRLMNIMGISALLCIQEQRPPSLTRSTRFIPIYCGIWKSQR